MTIEHRYRMGQGAWPYDTEPYRAPSRPLYPWLAVIAWVGAALVCAAVIAVAVS